LETKTRGVFRPFQKGTVMATIMNSVLFEESGLSAANVSAALQTYPDVLGAVYASHYRYVLKVCRRFLWRREDAEDAAAEVFLKLHAVSETEEHPINSRPWLSKVTGRHCIDKLRQAKAERRRRVDEVEFDTLPDSATLSPLSRILRREQQRKVQDEVRRLPRDYRILLVLHFYRQMTYAEIALTMGKQLPAIKTAIFRAKRMLRDKAQAKADVISQADSD
jgi:RNA polymerase sigma factor (sigma-70 family)